MKLLNVLIFLTGPLFANNVNAQSSCLKSIKIIEQEMDRSNMFAREVERALLMVDGKPYFSANNTKNYKKAYNFAKQERAASGVAFLELNLLKDMGCREYDVSAFYVLKERIDRESSFVKFLQYESSRVAEGFEKGRVD